MLLASQPLKADYSSDFASNTDGWSGADFNLESSGSEWDDLFTQKANGFTGNANPNVKDDRLYVDTMFAKLDLRTLGGLAAYTGGSIDLKWTDDGLSSPTSNGVYTYPVAQWIFMTGTVGGETYTLGYSLPLTGSNDVSSLSIQLVASNFLIINDITYTSDLFAGPATDSVTLDVTTGGYLSDIDFEEFLATSDGLYIRARTWNDGMVGSELALHGTRLVSLDIKSAAYLIPEPSGVLLAMLGMTVMLKRRKPLQKAQA